MVRCLFWHSNQPSLKTQQFTQSPTSIRTNRHRSLLFWAPSLLKSLKTLGNRPPDGLLSVFATVICYGKRPHSRPESLR